MTSISASSDDKLIPRKIIFGNPDKTNVQISKDGKYISYLSDKAGILNVFITPINDINNAYSTFSEKINYIYNKYFPLKTRKVKILRDNCRPWITGGIITSARTKNKLYNKKQQFGPYSVIENENINI